MMLKNVLRKARWAIERKKHEKYINLRDRGEFVFVDVGLIGWLVAGALEKSNEY